MKRVVACILLLTMAFAFVACEANYELRGDTGYIRTSEEGSGVYGIGGYGIGKGEFSNKVVYSEAPDGIVYDGEGAYGGEGDERDRIQAGQLTAKAWNDNENYDKWLELYADGTDNDPSGKLNDYKNGLWAYDTFKRVKVTVTENEKAVVGAEVKYIAPSQKSIAVLTDVSGVAYLFPQEDASTVTVKSGSGEATASFTAEDRDLTVALTESKAHANVIKMMFVIDATGSMGDEMNYITTELADVVHRVAAQSQQVRIDLALLFYRDDGDQEKFAYHTFKNVTEEAGLNTQIDILSKQNATGGGDLPEAVDEALVLAAGKDWGEENSTKLMFLVLDAPPHSSETNRDRTFRAVEAAAAKGIRICPVLCSGADTMCEYVTRLGALLTGGTSVFVTDDSGIGGEHLDPDLPDAVVERLNDLMVRLIVGYHTGDFGTPVAWNAGQETQSQSSDPVQ